MKVFGLATASIPRPGEWRDKWTIHEVSLGLAHTLRSCHTLKTIVFNNLKPLVMTTAIRSSFLFFTRRLSIIFGSGRPLRFGRSQASLTIMTVRECCTVLVQFVEFPNVQLVRKPEGIEKVNPTFQGFRCRAFAPRAIHTRRIQLRCLSSHSYQ